jgi:hypothetical protein
MRTLLIIVFLASGILFAATGKLVGKITDQDTHQPLIGANVSITGSNLGAATDLEGDFTIVELPAGSYNIEIEYIGYQKQLKSNIIVRSGITTVLNIKMSPEIIEGEGTRVVASYFSIPKEAVISSRSMDFEEVRRAPGSNADIQRVVQALPSVVSGSDQMNEIIIRGGNPGENLFVMDHIEIPNPNHFGEQGAGGGPINLLNAMMVENIDFYAGAFSAKFGDKASSVMDISLREGAKDNFHFDLDLGMAGAGGIFEGPIDNGNGSFIVSARRSFLDLIISNTGLSAVPEYYNLQSKINYDFSPKNKLIVNGAIGVDRIRIEDQEGGSDGYNRGAENVLSKNKQFIGGATLRTLWSKKVVSFITASAIRNEYNSDVYSNDDGLTYFLNESIEDEYMLKTEFSWQLNKRVTVDFGSKVKFSQFDNYLWTDADTLFDYESQPGDAIFERVLHGPIIQEAKAETYKSGTYLQLKYKIVPSVEIQSGLRYDYFDYTSENTLSPRLGVSWQTTPATKLSLAVGRIFQSPSYLVLTANPLNASLKDRYADQVVAGAEYLFNKDTRLTLEVYHKRYENVPVERELTSIDPYAEFFGEYVDTGKGRATGIEFYLHKKLTENWSGIISYSYSKSESKDLRYDKWIPSDYDYGHVFTFIGGYKWSDSNGDEYEVSAKLRYLGGRPYTEPTYVAKNRRWIVTGDQDINNKRYPDYFRMDVRFDQRYFFENFNIVTYIDVANVFNQSNIWSYQYNEDGSREDILQYEVFPVGGVTFEF